MIIAVDTQFLSKNLRRTGTGVYVYNLLRACLRVAGYEAPSTEFRGFIGPGEHWEENGFESARLRIRKTRLAPGSRAWRFGGMAVSAMWARPDLVFLPTALGAIPAPFTPVVSTILDAMPTRLPSEMVEVGAGAKFMTWMNAKLARKVITISERSKRDLMEIYRLPPEKVEVTYLGYDKQLYNAMPPDPSASAALLGRFGIRKPFVLHHGMVQLRKNIHRLIEAWDLVRAQNKSFDAQLVLAGPKGLGHERILKAREASPNCRQIIFTGTLPEAELALVVKNASLCIIPSLYEGFCLPMVEAMACGVPTVASNSSCLPEVSGSCLEYFNPLSPEEMARSICRALSDENLRQSLQDKGVARAAEFSWERCARETMRIFVEAAAV